MDKSSIHIISELGKNIAVIGSSGSWFELDEMGMDILATPANPSSSENDARLSNKYSTTEINYFINTIEGALKKANTLAKYSTDRQEVINKMYLQVTTRCNLRCRYCYAEETAGTSTCEMMTSEIARKAIDLLLEENRDQETCVLDFDGGEPMLNRPLIEDVVDYIKLRTKNNGPRVRMTIASNGTTMTPENVDFLNNNKIAFGISFDGPPDIQNNIRPSVAGRQSYDFVMDNIGPLLAKRRIIAQATITPLLLDVDEIVFHLADLGFNPVQAEPAYACADKKCQIKPNDIPALTNGFTRMAEMMLTGFKQGRLLPFYNFTEILTRLHKRRKRQYGCSVGAKMCAVAPDGNIYPCYRFWGNENYKMGTVAKGFNRSVQRLFSEAYVDNREGCKDCWARYFCGGKCLYLALYFNKDVNKPYDLNCQIFKCLLSLSIGLYQHIHGSPGLTEQLELSRNK